MKTRELGALRHRIAWLQRKQYDLMPLAENRRVARKLAGYLVKYHRLNHRFIIANTWASQDVWNGRLKLVDQIDYLLDQAEARVGDTCLSIVHTLFHEMDYFDAHDAPALASSTWREARQMQHFVHVVGRAMDRTGHAYQHGDYYHAYIHASQLRHLLNLAKPVKHRD